MSLTMGTNTRILESKVKFTSIAAIVEFSYCVLCNAGHEIKARAKIRPGVSCKNIVE